MADMFINIDVSSGLSRAQSGPGNQKHKEFMRKRKYLERCRLLKQKQLPNKNRGQPKNALDRGQPKNALDRGQPKNALDRGQPKNALDRGQPKNMWDSSQPKFSWDRSQPKNTWDCSRANGQSNRAGRQQGALDGSSRTVTAAGPRQPGTLSVSINCAANRPPPAAPSKDRDTPTTDRAKVPTRPHIPPPSLLLSEYESGLPPATAPSHKLVAIDCEMVGTGPKGRISALARCSIVNYQGDVIYDKYIRPVLPVTDYRSRWSGIRREHLYNATPFSVAQKEVLKLLHGKVVIGHAIQNDYKALGYFHPQEMTRDTSKIPLLNRKAGFPEKETASLKRLSKQLLHKDIQVGKRGHSSVEDAKATMELYRVVELEHERELAAGAAQP